MDLSSIRQTVLDGRTKGIPGTAEPFALERIAEQGWNVLNEDLPLPLMVLKRSALDANARIFGDYLAENGLSLAPHGKTTMSPQLFAEQLANGAWGLTAATVNQVQVMRHYGVPRVVLANQLLGKSHLHTIATEINAADDFTLFCFVDSVAQLRNMIRHLDGVALDRPIRLLIEVGVAGGRTGLRTRDEAMALAEAIAGAGQSQFRFAGVAAFEGVVPGIDKTPSLVSDFAELVVDIVRALPAPLYAGLDEFVLSGGGSAYFDLVAERFKNVELSVPVRVLLRSGCYITNDHGSYQSAQNQA